MTKIGSLHRGVPAWDIARLYPAQGYWDEGDYLELNRNTNHFVEFSDGRIEVLEMPTRSHQRLVLYLYGLLNGFAVARRLGEAIVAPYPVRLWKSKFREPDIVFMVARHSDRLGENFARGADLVVEVVSDDRHRDFETKRKEYAQAKIAEYWVVDPREQQVTVLKLVAKRYVVHGVFGLGERITSLLLASFEVDVTALFAAAKARRGGRRR